jgi:hypothetical protein
LGGQHTSKTNNHEQRKPHHKEKRNPDHKTELMNGCMKNREEEMHRNGRISSNELDRRST